MLNLLNVKIRNQNGDLLIDTLNLQVHEHDRIGIIGEEGNGKSTLLKAIADLSWITDYAGIEGTISKERNLKIGYFAQAMEPIWKDTMIFEYLLKPFPEAEIKQEQYNELQVYAKEAQQLKMDVELLQRDQLLSRASGGEKVKLRMLKMLHEQPDVLLLDEPTNDLDLDTLDWLESFMLECSKPILFISHDDVLLERCANRIIHIEQRNHRTKPVTTVANVTYREYVESRGMRIEREQRQAKKEKAEYTKKKIKLNDLKNAVHDALNDTVRSPFYAAGLARRMANLQAVDKRFEKTGYARVDSVEEAIDVAFDTNPLPPAKIILNADFPKVKVGDRVLLEDVHLQIRGSDKLALIGPNGCGKTVFMNQIYERLKDRSDIRIGYMPQDYARAFDGYPTPVAYLLSTGDKADVTRSRDLLGRMKFTADDMLRPCASLSEGQKAKLCLLKFIKEDCDVLLLDEPTRNLSPLSAPVIRRILTEYSGCIVSISHDRAYLQSCVNTVYEIRERKLTAVNDIL